jgi:hypothetical protein
MSLGDLFGSTSNVIDTGANLLGSIFQNKSIEESNREAAIRSAANQERALNAFTGSTPDMQTTRNPQGGFDVGYTPGSVAETQNIGDLDRAAQANWITQNMKPTFGGVGEAKQYLAADYANQLAGAQGAMDDYQAGLLRRGGGVGNPLLDAINQQKVAETGAKIRGNLDEKSLATFNTQNQADQQHYANQLANLGRRSPTLSPPGAGAASVVAQTPPPTPSLTTNIPALLGATVSDHIAGVEADAARLAAEEQNSQLLEALLGRLRGDQPSNIG